MTELRTKADVIAMAKEVVTAATDLYALETFDTALTAEIVQDGDTQDRGFYSDQTLGTHHGANADYLRNHGVDLGHQFDYIHQDLSNRALYDADAYATALQGLNAAIDALQMGGSGTTDAALGKVAGSGEIDEDLPVLPSDWTGVFINNLKTDVIAHVPYHRPYHTMLICGLAAALRSQMNLHETYIQRLYDIAEATRNRLRSCVQDSDVDGFDVTVKVLGIALAVAGVAGTVITGGASLSITLAVLGAGLTTATNVKGIGDDYEKGQTSEETYKSSISGSTSTDIIDSMMDHLRELDLHITIEEGALGVELGRSASSLSAVIAAADSTEGITPNWTPWRVRSKRTNLADGQPDSSSEMAHDESDYLQ